MKNIFEGKKIICLGFITSFLLAYFLVQPVNPVFAKCASSSLVGCGECKNGQKECQYRCNNCGTYPPSECQVGQYGGMEPCGGGGGGGGTCTGKCAKTGSSIPRLENEPEDCTRHGNKSDCENHGGYGCRWSEQCPPPPCNPNTWGAWGACSKTCGGGTQARTNACGTTQSQACNTQACPPLPTNTLIPPTAVPPTAVPPTAPPTCPRKSQGDANCDGKVSGLDYSVWLNSQCNPGAGQTCANLRADFNADGKVNDDDYNIWFGNRGS